MPSKKRQKEVAAPAMPNQRTCGTMNVHHRLLRTVSGYREARDAVENQAFRAAISPQAFRIGCTKIPVVVHVVFNTAAQNISDEQIASQIAILNADFRRKNGDVSSTPSVFLQSTADARIEFELATRDPGGNPTGGITRTSTTQVSFLDDDAIKSSATGGADAWDATRYLNIWVAPALFDELTGQSLLGYAQFPGGAAATDGVVIRHSAFGNTGTAAAPFNLGRTTTHEVGHWLNLLHIWGDDGNGCAGSDQVADTPNQADSNTGTPTFPQISCSNGPNGDMFMNYMDYVDDAAMFMFTGGQVTRMQATLDGARSTIGITIPCLEVDPKNLIKENPKDNIKENVKENNKEFNKEFNKESLKDFNKENPKELIKENLKENSKENNKEFNKEVNKEVNKENPKDNTKENPKDNVKEFNKDNNKDNVKDNNKDWFKDRPKDNIKENNKENPKENVKEFNKEFNKENPKDGFKDNPKDNFKDQGKDGSKDNPKENVKEFNKDFNKDNPNDKSGSKDIIKDLKDDPNKVLIKDWNKDVFGDNQKPVFTDPPKLIVEPPPDRFWQQPFGGVSGPQTTRRVEREQAGILANMYGRLLTHYARLYSAGLLDAQGMAAWQETATVYAQFVAAMGQM